MLQSSYREHLTELLRQVPCRVEVPVWFREYVGKTGPVSGVWNERRRFTRFYFARSAVLRYHQPLPAVERSAEPQRVLTKDISQNGLSFLHHEQVFPGEIVLLMLPDGTRKYHVARCHRLNPHCFEIGAILVR